MKRRSIQSPSAPAAVGAYSPAVRVEGPSDWLFVSGQIGLDPKTGALVPGGVGAEIECALRNLEVTLHAAGFRFEDIVKATLYLLDMNDFAKANARYAACFPGLAPARSTVAVTALPKGAAFEIDAIAAR